jgi:DnaK suppressor protein
LALGTYRRCQRCGQEIPGERLDALPATRTCVTCARASC